MTAEDAALYEQHRQEVTRNREERLADKKLEKTLYLVAVCDVEKLLQCPRLKNGKQYYLCKLQIKNWTAFDLLTSDVLCKLFDETQGGSDGNIYASLLCWYVEGKIIETPTISTAIIWSDGCASQNRCVLVSNALLQLAMRLKILIIQKYLVPGHSQNEVDSAHARIESSTKELILYSPSQFADAIRKARLSEENGGRRGVTPYRVEMVTFDEFFNFEGAKMYSSIRPGYKSGDPTVMNVRALAYHPDGKMKYKLSFDDDWTDMPHRIEHPTNLVRKKYTEPIPLTASKFRDLQKLKEFIPEDFHKFYDELPHN
ncbi:hypothetical protein B566_EDAN016352 [Ephemera danica]|nr:hypothetical protein B566_EDAN016352 [Ephemera danica]